MRPSEKRRRHQDAFLKVAGTYAKQRWGDSLAPYLLAAGIESVETIRRYGNHLVGCPKATSRRRCTCGFADAWKRWCE